MISDERKQRKGILPEILKYFVCDFNTKLVLAIDMLAVGTLIAVIT